MNRRDGKNDVIEIDLLEIVMLLWHHAVLIIGVGMMFAIAAYALATYVIPPYYQSTTKIYILNKTETAAVTYSDTQLATQLTKDYSELITSRYVIEQVIQEHNLEVDYDDMLEKISVNTPTDTRIVEITVEDNDPVVAMNICNSIREVASEHIQNVMDIDAVNVVETANMPEEKAGPSGFKSALIAGMAGCVLVAAGIFIRYMLNDSIRSSDDIERYLELSTLALIPIDESELEEESTKKKRKKRSRNAGSST